GGDRVVRGGYVLRDAEGGPAQVVLVATGSEVSVCVAAADALGADGIRARVVSLPCWLIFESQTDEYRGSVLPDGVPTLSVEAAPTFGWSRWADDSLGIGHFGSSAPGSVVLERFGFTPENVAARARALID